MSRLFVYGTLKRGLRNHTMLSHCPFIGQAMTFARFYLVDLGAYPGMVPFRATLVKRGVARSLCAPVRGEVYDISKSPSLLEKLDDLEGVPFLFNREKISVLIDGLPMKEPEFDIVWAYVFQSEDVLDKDRFLVPRKGVHDWHPRIGPGQDSGQHLSP